MDTLIAPSSFLSQPTYPYLECEDDLGALAPEQMESTCLLSNKFSSVERRPAPSSVPANATKSMHFVCELEPKPTKTHPCRDVACSKKNQNFLSPLWGWSWEDLYRLSLPYISSFRYIHRRRCFLLPLSYRLFWKEILKKGGAEDREIIWKVESSVFHFFPPIVSSL